jgi:hypothetical protein
VQLAVQLAVMDERLTLHALTRGVAVHEGYSMGDAVTARSTNYEPRG